MLSSFGTAISAQTQKSQTATVAAPTGGWNARDALGSMDPLDAVTLTNFWPGVNSVIVRNGYSKFATDIAGQIETLMTYSSGTANKLFAAATTKVYNVTAGGSIGAADISSLTNARWQYCNFTTVSGSYLVMVNGADKLRIYDGSDWHKDGDGPPYDISGVDSATCDNIINFKNRLWLVQEQTLVAWYLPINAIGGAATSLNMSSLFRMGGSLVAGMTWTLDAGYGMDDYLAFITSNGEVAVWRLTDPTTPSGISLIGIYTLGAPVGKRCFLKYGGDLLIITQDGVVPMSGALQSSRLDPRVSITNKIQYAMSSAISLYGANFGWQLIYFAKENQLYLNVPVMEGSQQQQYAQNNITLSWCNFKGWNANCWEIYENNPYFGGEGFIGKAWDTNADNAADIDAYALQSFQTYGSATQKQCRMIRYHMLTNGGPDIYGNVNVNYDITDTTAALSATITQYGVWDTSTWGLGIWGAGLVPVADWQGVTGIGYTFAPVIRTSSNRIQVQWVASDMVFEGGGVL